MFRLKNGYTILLLFLNTLSIAWSCLFLYSLLKQNLYHHTQQHLYTTIEYIAHTISTEIDKSRDVSEQYLLQTILEQEKNLSPRTDFYILDSNSTILFSTHETEINTPFPLELSTLHSSYTTDSVQVFTKDQIFYVTKTLSQPTQQKITLLGQIPQNNLENILQNFALNLLFFAVLTVIGVFFLTNLVMVAWQWSELKEIEFLQHRLSNLETYITQQSTDTQKSLPRSPTPTTSTPYTQALQTFESTIYHLVNIIVKVEHNIRNLDEQS